MPTVTDYTALLSGSYWNGIEVTGKPVIVTYSFPTTPTDYLAATPGFTAGTLASFSAFNAAEQSQARAALGEWAAASAIVFIEVAPGDGDINFQLIDFDTTSGPSYAGAGGIGFYPFGDWNFFTYPSFSSDLDLSGDVFMNAQFSGGGTVNYGTLLHEIGHALGLKHPTEIVTDFAASPVVVHDQVLASDDPAQTVMATAGDGTPANDVHLHQLDADAAAFVYGGAGTGAVVTGNASGANAAVSAWSWNAATQVLTQTGFAGDDAIRGSSVTDIIDGLAGNNRLFGLAGNDTLSAASGGDFLDGGAGDDSMTGGAGDDVYIVGDAGDVVNEAANGGYDTVYASTDTILAANVELLQMFGDGLTGQGNALANSIFGDGVFANSLFGLGGNDYIVAGAAGDALHGGDGVDTLYGQDGADSLTGDAGNDFVFGGNGDDIVAGGANNDSLSGDAGVDTVTYAAATARVVVNLSLTGVQATLGAGSDTLSGFENLTGTAFNDTLTGAADANVLTGGLGLDTLNGLAGNDLLLGGDGNDVLQGGDGDDAIDGGAGTDIASFAAAGSAVTVSLLLAGAQNTLGAGTDTLTGIEGLTGSAFNDTLIGDAGANTLNGGTGNDTLRGDLGNDVIDGGSGVDTLDYSAVGAGITLNLISQSAQNTIGAGTDTVRGIENVIGTAFADTITGNEFGNALTAGDGNDMLVGGLGNDVLNGGSGLDTANYATATAGVKVNLTILTAQTTVGAGGDTLSGIENLNGTGFDDQFTGDGGDNVLTGNGGNDTLLGGLGNDTLSGGQGTDTISYVGAASGVMVNLGLTTAQNTIGAGSDTMSSIENLVGSALADTLTGSIQINVISGGNGNDLIDGGSSNDTLDGGANDDTLKGGTGDDLLTGGTGNDSIDGGANLDTISYAAAGSGVTVSLALATAQAVGGGQGSDTIVNVENILGSAFADTLIGSTLANVLTGGGGKDSLTGGAGNDRFVYLATADSVVGANADRIADFAAGDILDLSGIDADANTVVTNDAFTQVGSFSSVAGQFTLAFDGGSNTTTLLGDTNGDGVADFSILFTGDVTALTGTWVL